MIYFLDAANYPQGDTLIEELVYNDLNGEEWRIARWVQGFVVKFCGEQYFKGDDFNCEILPTKFLKIKNTGILFFMNTNFDIFCEIRTMLTTNWTDDIWEIFKALFMARFKAYPIVLLSELA